ncbi:hypothetical protein A0H81_11492 [Grifola frondosa]|uniref:F-box domain-containing protein n=1 Tax=Grifola frondosa TaxID=5627 RepID=A0A1C7LWL5_GRIFR|nr:hypothetical protein A0H81_11492 [Grifola frondosa]
MPSTCYCCAYGSDWNIPIFCDRPLSSPGFFFDSVHPFSSRWRKYSFPPYKVFSVTDRTLTSSRSLAEMKSPHILPSWTMFQSARINIPLLGPMTPLFRIFNPSQFVTCGIVQDGAIIKKLEYPAGAVYNVFPSKDSESPTLQFYGGMHRCFIFPDILMNIFEQTYEGGYDVECRRAVASLSLACRMFHKIGVQVLWSRLFSMRPLIKCMPAESLTRPPDPSDWERFQANALHVTSYKRHGLAPDIDEETFRILSLYRPPVSHLLPNLRELVWEEPQPDVFEYAYQLLGPKIVTLHLGNIPNDALLLPILRCIHVRTPLLRHLSVQSHSDIATVEPVLSHVICQLQQLQTFNFTLPIVEDAVMHLAMLPSLTVAKFFVSFGVDVQSHMSAIVSPIFPAIRVLHVSAVRLDPSTAHFIGLISSVQLTEVQLSSLHDPPQSIVRDHLSALCRCPSHDTLAVLHLVFPLEDTIPQLLSLESSSSPMYRPECLLNIQTLQPILDLGCGSLTDLEIVSVYLDLDNYVVLMLSIALPHLQSLKLLPPYNGGRISKVTPEGIVPLLRNCRDLTYLGITINASVPVRALDLPDECIHDSELLTLDVADSPVCFPEDVAAFLSAYCTNPSFEILSAYAHEGDHHPEHIRMRELYSSMWDQVGRLLRLFTKVRTREREYWMKNKSTQDMGR